VLFLIVITEKIKLIDGLKHSVGVYGHSYRPQMRTYVVPMVPACTNIWFGPTLPCFFLFIFSNSSHFLFWHVVGETAKVAGLQVVRDLIPIH